MHSVRHDQHSSRPDLHAGRHDHSGRHEPHSGHDPMESCAISTEEILETKKEKKFKPGVAFTHKYTREMLLEFEETFELICTDDGFMEVEKVPLVLQALGLEVNQKFYDQIIEPSTRFIDFEKYLTIVDIAAENSNGVWMAHEIQEAFNIFDKDQNGSLDATELKRVFTKLGEHMSDKEMEDQIKDYDLDRDGEMNAVEFVVMVQSCKGLDFGVE